MNKNMLFLGIISAVVVVACSAGGAILALNTTTSDENNKSQSNYEALQKEKIKLNGWKEENAGWYYYVDDMKQNNWIQDKNSWYYLASDGKMRTDWIQDKNKWYYLGSDGKMRIGWIKYNDKWYYLNNDGTMVTNTTVDGNYINENGLIEETPKPKESTDVGQANINKTRVLTVEEARQVVIKYLNRSSGLNGWDRTYQLTGVLATEIEDKYNCYTFVPEFKDGADDDGAICVNKYTGQLYSHDPSKNTLTPI